MRVSTKRPSKKTGFTLIEIMVATAVMVVMVGLVIQITSQVLNVWNRSTGQLAANAEARIAMEVLTSDLEMAVFRNNGMQWLRAEKVETDLGTNTVALRLFAPAQDRPEGPGDICAIAYQLENRDPVSGSAAEGSPDDRLWILYRLVVNPENTFTDLMGEGNQNVVPSSDGSSSYEPWPDFVDDGKNYLARNVVEFSLDFFVHDDGQESTQTKVEATSNNLSDNTIFGSGVPNPNLRNGGATVGPQAYSWESTPTKQQLAYRQPLAYAEIRLTVISDEGALLLQNIGNIPEDKEDVIREYGRVFTRRVNFSAQPF
jgi:prepilin-type N-terminal cleavage/methylation domain-containing protein